MTEDASKENSKRDPETESAPSETTAKKRSWKLKVLAAIFVVAVALIGAHSAGLLQKVVPPKYLSVLPLKDIQQLKTLLPLFSKDAESENTVSPAFSKGSSSELFSKIGLLKAVGKSPVDPSRVLFPSFRGTVVAEDTETKELCPPPKLPSGLAALESKENPADSLKAAVPPAKASATNVEELQLVETPVIVSRTPKQAEINEEKTKAAPTKNTASKDLKKSVGKQSAVANSGKGRESTEASKRKSSSSKVVAPDSKIKNAKNVPAGDEKAGRGATERPEKYELPGSLKVKIRKYEGVSAKWALMVILDDSAVMARKSKVWTPNRMTTAQDFVGQLDRMLTPDSSLAVRDFYCRRVGKGKRRSRTRCLSHKLLTWSDSPFSGLKEKLADANPKGVTNPCAAAAYSLKKDFQGLGKLVPRLVVVTSGRTKCGYSGVLKVINSRWGKERPKVDVIALGIGKRRQGGYVRLAKKTGGAFVKLGKPADLKSAVAKYKKVLETRIVEKLKVRGDNVVFSVAPDEELTLAPGKYTVVLPDIAGLKPSKREIPNVKIDSGKSNVLNIKIAKGRAVVASGKR
jgi:hypothetical protein